MSYRVNQLLYAAGPDLINAIRITIALTEPVNACALETALEKAAVRFPFFAVKLIRRESVYTMEPNELPFVVSPGGRTVTLGSKQSNYHLFAFAYDNCRLYVDTVHFITDGNGLLPFLKTILYCYLSLVHPEAVFETAGIALPDSAVPEEETDDYPYPDEPLDVQPLGKICRPAEVFMLPGMPQGYESADHWTSFRYRIRQKDMMKFISGVDGSPASFVASLMYLVISETHPETALPVVCGMQHQFRGALGKPRSHMCHVNIVPMVFPPCLRGKSIERLNTIARGMLILHADDANDAMTVNSHVLNEKLIQEMTLSQKREYMRGVIMEGIGKNTFEVSYTGRVAWSGLDRYITDVVPCLDMTLSGGLSVEIFSVGDSFSINIMQRSGRTAYADRFTELLRDNGVAFESAEPEHFSLCGFCLPD